MTDGATGMDRKPGTDRPARVRPERRAGHCSTEAKVELVLRLLGGETLTQLARETGRPKKQLSTWRRRFVAGGEAYLDGRRERAEAEAHDGDRDRLPARVAELETDNAMLARRLDLLHVDPERRLRHPYCSEAHLKALEEPGVSVLAVPEWGSSVLVREGLAGGRQATGIRPIAPLEPRCDLGAGLEALRSAGVSSVSLVADPMWCPQPSALRAGFDTCLPFREHYLVDRERGIHYQKRHRNRINQARRVGEVEEVRLVEHLDRWHQLYAQNIASRQIAQPFSESYFERLATMPELRTVAVRVHGEIAAITLWVRHWDTLYFHDGASSAAGFASCAAYAAYAHAIETETRCRYILLGGSAGFQDERLEGLAKFRRGFSNGSIRSYLCGAALKRTAR